MYASTGCLITGVGFRHLVVVQRALLITMLTIFVWTRRYHTDVQYSAVPYPGAKVLFLSVCTDVPPSLVIRTQRYTIFGHIEERYSFKVRLGPELLPALGIRGFTEGNWRILRGNFSLRLVSHLITWKRE